MPFFDFLTTNKRYAGRRGAMNRLEQRRRFIVEPYVDDLRGARVLDLASNDGRWSYALAAAGAREVVGIEARRELIDQFSEYPDDEHKVKVSFIAGDIFDELPRLIAAGERFDVVAIYGLFYHIMDHYRLLKLVRQLGPRLIIIDSEFTRSRKPSITLRFEDTRKDKSTIAHVDGQRHAPIGIVSRRAVGMMARSLGYTVEWADWSTLPESQRQGLADYLRSPAESNVFRGTCALRPGPPASVA